MNNNTLTLIVEDDPSLREALCDTLKLANHPVIEAEDAETALHILAHKKVNLIISDVQMPGMDGHQFLKLVKRQHPDIPFVLITAHGTVTKAVDAIQAGAADYIIKPFEAEVLIEVVNRLAQPAIDHGQMIIADKRSQALAELSRRIAATDVTVMISGESGTGKEVYSKYIHQCSDRKDGPFMAINCAAIPEAMLESILFGYEKGAFTGAYTARAGKFEQANQGTLLLDEISEMDISLQAKLLRVIQEKEVERLGGKKTIPLDVRIIATTNRNLKDEVTAGRFREDLFYRLNVFPLQLAPLRERTDDIMPLVHKFIEHFNPGKGIQVDKLVEASLTSHPWRGNVRELENVIQRALILRTGLTITQEDIIFEEVAATYISSVEQPEFVVPNIDNPAVPNVDNNVAQLESDLKTREKEIIINAVSAHSSRKDAALQLGISPRTLRYKLAQFRKDGVSIPCLPNTARAI